MGFRLQPIQWWVIERSWTRMFKTSFSMHLYKKTVKLMLIIKESDFWHSIRATLFVYHKIEYLWEKLASNVDILSMKLNWCWTSTFHIVNFQSIPVLQSLCFLFRNQFIWNFPISAWGQECHNIFCNCLQFELRSFFPTITHIKDFFRLTTVWGFIIFQMSLPSRIHIFISKRSKWPLPSSLENSHKLISTKSLATSQSRDSAVQYVTTKF